MTSTSSADATILPSRRALITQAGMLASIGAAGATMAIPALASEPGPIELMHAEHVRLTRVYDAAMEATWDAEERYEEPERPRWHPFYQEGGYNTITTSPGRGCCVLDDGPKNVAFLKDLIDKEHEPDDPDAGYSNAPRAQRARQTLARIEEWRRRTSAAPMPPA